MLEIYASRRARDWGTRLYRALQPPAPLIRNPAELLHSPLGRWNLYVGGGGLEAPQGYINVDMFALPGVDVSADAEQLPFSSGVFQCIECDAVLEHTRNPDLLMRELSRVLTSGGHRHVVTPFCHPFHEYPRDFWRFTPDGLKQLAGRELEVVSEGWRTGPTATMSVFLLEYFKLWLPWRAWRVLVHGVPGWVLFPFRYLDLLFFRSGRGGAIGNHYYVWFRKR